MADGDDSESNPYRPPDARTVRERSRGDVVWSEQSLFGAFFGGALGAFIGVAVWMMGVILTGDNALAMGLLVAVCVGFFVRFNGRGLTVGFRVIAIAFAWVGVIAGMWFTGLAHGPRSAFGLLIFTAIGVIAASLACRPLDMEDRKAVWRFRNGVADKSS